MSEHSDGASPDTTESLRRVRQLAIQSEAAPFIMGEIVAVVDMALGEKTEMPEWIGRQVAIGAEAEPVACPKPDADSVTYYKKGKDGPYWEGLDDAEFAEELEHACQDLNDTGLGDDLDKWMPFQIMMADAAERINRLCVVAKAALANQGGGK